MRAIIRITVMAVLLAVVSTPLYAAFAEKRLSGFHVKEFLKEKMNQGSVDIQERPIVKSQNTKMSMILSNYIRKEKSSAGYCVKSAGNRISIMCKTNKVINCDSVVLFGGTVRNNKNGMAIIEAPADMIEDIVNDVDGIQYASLPHKFLPFGVTSEGVGVTSAPDLHAAGFTGAGIRIAVIDIGFGGFQDAIDDNDLPADVLTCNFTAEDLESGSTHGTACAEVVHDMAPDAELHLLKVLEDADIYDAFDYCIENGINIVSMSIGTAGIGPGNGTGPMQTICDELRETYSVFITSAAGNFGIMYTEDGMPLGTHWEGVFTDSDSDYMHDFKTTAYEYNLILAASYPGEVGEVAIQMRWDDWPNATVDYDMYLYNYFTGALAAYSIGLQNGSQPPEETILLDLPDGTEFGFYKLVVKRSSSSPAGKKFEIYLPGDMCAFVPLDGVSPSLLLATSSSSLVEPADAGSVFTVGAIDYNNWASGPQEDFSSQGPTNDWAGSAAVIKPDVCGPDGVSTMTYGEECFYGTSASTPHIAGAAAIILSMHPYLSPDELQNILEAGAFDMGSAGKDNIYGSGKAALSVYNNAPILDPIGNKLGIENSAMSFTVDASDADHDTLIYSVLNLPTGASFDSGTRSFSWTPDQAGTYENIRFQVSDGQAVDWEDIVVTVNTVNSNNCEAILDYGEFGIHVWDSNGTPPVDTTPHVKP